MDYQRRLQAMGISTVPIVIAYPAGKRLYWAPARYRVLGAATMGHRSWTLRELARRTGYSVTGLRHALARLASWGAISVASTRGWAGRTVIRWASDVVAHANVPTTVTESPGERSISVTVHGTLTEPGPEAPPSGGSWRDECARIVARMTI
jgi:lambda repressor-like predicted transcriptional regulator